jgi:hypothetical protein
MEFSKRDKRIMVEFLRRMNYSPVKIHEEIDKAFGERTISYSGVCKLAAEFQSGDRSDFDDIYRGGRPISCVRAGMQVDLVKQHLYDDPLSSRGFTTWQFHEL